MKNIFKLEYICWKGDNLHSSGEKNYLKKNVVAETQRSAARKLRDSLSALETITGWTARGEIEIVSITLVGQVDVE